MKYVILKRKNVDVLQLVPIIFPNFLVHKHVAQAILHLPGNPYNIENVVYSAGEITIEEPYCFGSSETLKIASKADDSEIIGNIDYEHGII